MKLILNGINGEYLRDVLTNGAQSTARVDAAVAYATQIELFNWCRDNKIPLNFWGRFDDGVPIAISILKSFVHDSSGIFNCRLVRHFHPKIIWWRGYGAYIGSANLTSAAWWGNVEGGVFLTDDEIEDAGKSDELNDFFTVIHKHSSPLTEEIVAALESRQRELNEITKKDKLNAERLLTNIHVSPWAGLTGSPSTNPEERHKQAFIAEWNETLQIIRGISETLAASFRPPWLSISVPRGAQVDQFLHAHYYQRTFEGKRAAYETQFQMNRVNPATAVQEAMTWWKALPTAPGSAADTLNVQAPRLAKLLTKEALDVMTETDLRDLLWRTHAAQDYARRVPNSQVYLPDGRTYTMEEKIEALSKCVWRFRSVEGKSIAETLKYALYGGPFDELPVRLWEATNTPKYRISNVGISTLGEIVGWALPDRFPPRNGRTSKALRSLGYDVKVHAGA